MGEGPAEVAAPLVDFPAAVGEDSPAAVSVEAVFPAAVGEDSPAAVVSVAAGFPAAAAVAVVPAADKRYTEKK